MLFYVIYIFTFILFENLFVCILRLTRVKNLTILTISASLLMALLLLTEALRTPIKLVHIASERADEAESSKKNEDKECYEKQENEFY